MSVGGGAGQLPKHRPVQGREEFPMREEEQDQPKVHEPMKMSVTIADQQHQQEMRHRSYELAVQRHHMRQ